MPVTPTYPGVYVQEVPSGVRTIVGVSTSIAVFIGRAKQGPMNEPKLCLNFSDFERVFSAEYAGSDMARAVRLFFQNGGTQCYAMRIAEGSAKSKVTLMDVTGNTSVMTVTAKSSGAVGDTIRFAVTYNGPNPESTFSLDIFRVDTNSAGSTVKKDAEQWTNLSMDPDSPRYVKDFVNQNSKLVDISVPTFNLTDPAYSESGYPVPSQTPTIFRTNWLAMMGTTGPVSTVQPWTGGAKVVESLRTYSGITKKEFAFTIGGTGTLTVGSDAITLNWQDDDGASGSINVAAAYTAGTPITVTENIALTLSSGNLTGGEQFKLEAWPTRRFRISVGNVRNVDVDLSSLDFNSAPLNTANGAWNNLAGRIQAIINSALPAGKAVTVGDPSTAGLLHDGPAGPSGQDNEATTVLRISSVNGDVKIEPAATFDLAARLMMGTAQGGNEVSRYSSVRPAPTGVVFNPGTDLNNMTAFSALAQDAFNTVTIDSKDISLGNNLITNSTTGARMYQTEYTLGSINNCDGVREKLSIIAAAVNARKDSDPEFKWSAEVWGSRLALIPGEGGENSKGSISTDNGSGSGNIGDYFTQNVRYYSLGANGLGPYQTSGAAGADGSAPVLKNYRDAFLKIDSDVDLFNLMIIPSDKDHDTDMTKSIWGPASVFCQRRRAFLLMDPPTSWSTVQKATHPSTGVNSLRVGLVKDHSAIFYPRITIRENGLKKHVGPSGAIAGLMSRIDGSRGVWKAAAGTEADLRGIVGLEHKFSDEENGVLNPRAVNTLRIFPNGIVNWGARTMDGDNDFGSEYKYIPIRRLALFMEESLYRGLKWVVFEPNDEPLWAQIRLNVGAFMHGLFRQGAFQGEKPKDAYFVKCDGETTTQNDRDLGIVNIWVGFAPLKPAEFVILYLQQMAGQIEV